MPHREQLVQPTASRRAILGGAVLLTVCVAVPGIAGTRDGSLPVVIRIWPDRAISVFEARRSMLAITQALPPLVQGTGLVWVQMMQPPVAHQGGAS